MQSADKLANATQMGHGLRSTRPGSTKWRLRLIDGPNMSNLGEGGRDQRTYGSVASMGELQDIMVAFATGLDVSLEVFQSNFQGDIVRYVYETTDETDAYLINPAGITRNGVSAMTALRDSRRPYIELHFANIAAVGWTESVFMATSMGVVMGLRHHGYIAAIYGLVLDLDTRIAFLATTSAGPVPTTIDKQDSHYE